METRSDVRVLVISGSMGSGKTTVLSEASDLLTRAKVVHVAFDLDHLALGYFSPMPPSLGVRNLSILWRAYADLGIRKLLLSGAMETQSALEELRVALNAKEVVVCRLIASVETMQERVRSREPGISQPELLERVVVLEQILDAAKVEDFRVDNENRCVTEVAREVLFQAQWIESRC